MLCSNVFLKISILCPDELVVCVASDVFFIIAFGEQKSLETQWTQIQIVQGTLHICVSMTGTCWCDVTQHSKRRVWEGPFLYPTSYPISQSIQSICQKIPKEKVTLLRFPCDMFKVEQRSLNYHICQRNLHIGEAGNKHFNLINVSNNGTEKLAICCVNYIDNYLKCLLLLSYLGWTAFCEVSRSN